MDKSINGKERGQRDYQEELTLKFILRIEEALADSEKGLKWQKPFFTCQELPRNALTGDKYSGCNIVALLSEDWTDPRWMTFMQIGELGRKLGKKLYVAGGQRASFVMKTIPVYQKDEEGEVIKDSKGKPIPVCHKDGSPKIAFKWYAVFNAGQIAGGMDPYIKPERVVKPNEAVEQLAAALVDRTGLKITHSERGRAFYSKSSHTVHMPERHLFETDEGYADCLLHELTHSTGPALNRDMTGRFGEESYAFEELVAQLGSVFMAKELGVPYDMSAHENSAAYLKSWLSTLKMDKNFLMRASAQASESVKWQLDHLSKYRAAPNETVPSASSAVEAETDMVSAMRPAPTRLGM